MAISRLELAQSLNIALRSSHFEWLDKVDEGIDHFSKKEARTICEEGKSIIRDHERQLTTKKMVMESLLLVEKNLPSGELLVALKKIEKLEEDFMSIDFSSYNQLLFYLNALNGNQDETAVYGKRCLSAWGFDSPSREVLMDIARWASENSHSDLAREVALNLI